MNAFLCPFKSSLEALTKTKFICKKNYQTNVLEDGLLSLPSDTVFFMDETELKEGKMAENAIANINAKANLIENQVLIYDFTYSQQEIPTRVPVVIASSSRTLFKNTHHFPLMPKASTEEL